MDDERVRDFETALWIGGEDVYRRSIAEDCLMVLPELPFVMTGSEAIQAVTNTPRWEKVELKDLKIMRPKEGLIVIGYEVTASRAEESYEASCTSTYIRLGHEHWQVVQHQQAIPTAGGGAGSDKDQASQSASLPEDRALFSSRERSAMEEAQAEAAHERESERGYQ